MAFTQRLGADGVHVDRWKPILAGNLKPVVRDYVCMTNDNIFTREIGLSGPAFDDIDIG